MIVESMSAADIRDEFFTGFHCLHNYMRKPAKRARRNLGTAPGRTVRVNYRDPLNNQWWALLITDGKESWLVPFLEYNDQQGHFRIISIHPVTGVLMVYTGHFFRRVAERAGITDDSVDVRGNILRFLVQNCKYEPLLRQDNHLQVEFPQGVGLGYAYGDDIYLVKTFLTHDMLRGQQAELSMQIREELYGYSAVSEVNHQAMLRSA